MQDDPCSLSWDPEIWLIATMSADIPGHCEVVILDCVHDEFEYVVDVFGAKVLCPLRGFVLLRPGPKMHSGSQCHLDPAGSQLTAAPC